MGTNIHAAFGGNFITNPQGVADVINDIGFRYVRDIPTTPDRLNALTAATGVKVCVISQYYWFGGDAFDVKNFDATWAQIKQVNNIAYLEMPNEPQNLDNYNDALHAWTLKLYQTAKADPALAATPIVSSSVAYPMPNLADLAPYLDYGNVHSYPSVYTAASNLPQLMTFAATVVGNKPIIATETGYANSYLDPGYFRGVSEAASAKYLPRLFLDHYNAGIVKTFNYELIDDYIDDTYTNVEAHLGIVHNDLSYKPAAYAIKNLIALLKDPGPADFTPNSLNYTLTTDSPDIHHTLLQKRDGSFWLALWQNVLSYDAENRRDLVVDPVDVTLQFGGMPLVKATTYLPNNSTAPTGSVTATQLVNLAIDDRVTLVQLRLAAPGDTNADGLINDTDVATFFRHYGQSVTQDGGWALGDFDRDGKVDFGDFQLMELNYGQAQYTPALQAEVAALIAANAPEPGAALSVLACVALLMRRTRRN